MGIDDRYFCFVTVLPEDDSYRMARQSRTVFVFSVTDKYKFWFMHKLLFLDPVFFGEPFFKCTVMEYQWFASILMGVGLYSH